MDPIQAGRDFLKSGPWHDFGNLDRDQAKNLPPPPAQKPRPDGAKLIDLVPADEFSLGSVPLLEVINQRRSRRKFTGDPLSLEELSFLLWTTQGVQKLVGGGTTTLRTCPSGGARHSLETYVIVSRVAELAVGLYRYQPLDHQLCLLREDPALPGQLAEACCGQKFVGEGAVIFAWTSIPYRMEWRYSVLSHKVIALDAGHVCQNLYLAAESIGAGTCGIGAYLQEQADALLGVDDKDELTVYLAPVGKILR
jgi:SagB-type dehydrogenase family enzyme